ncbi:MAG: DUF4166 domain-containing protein [Alphaproteobacteria bacterium]
MSPERERYLFARILGDSFDALPEPIRSMHEVSNPMLSEGRCLVEGGRNPLARLIAGLMRLPPASPEAPIEVFMHRHGVSEIWERRIAGRRFVSRLSSPDGRFVVEKIGPVAFRFALRADRAKLSMLLRGVRVFGLPWPKFLWPRISAHETLAHGKFHFEVSSTLPLIGLIVAYRGNLTPKEGPLPAAPGRPIVLFDGVCNFCNWGVNFLLRWDRSGVIRFAAMQSEPGLRLLRANDLSESDFETFYVLDGSRVLRRSEAVLYLNRYMAWPWRVARVLALVPRRLRDAMYDMVARNRYRLMGVREVCRVPSADEKQRFLSE